MKPLAWQRGASSDPAPLPQPFLLLRPRILRFLLPPPRRGQDRPGGPAEVPAEVPVGLSLDPGGHLVGHAFVVAHAGIVGTSYGQGVEILGAMQTPDGQWRVETVRQRDQEWLQVVHEGVAIQFLSLESARAILKKAGVDWAELVPVERLT